MAEPWLSTGANLPEVFATDPSEASARRTKGVQRASKITGKLFLALGTLGRGSAPKTSVAQLAAKAAQVEHPVDITPEALQQRLNERAVAFLQDLRQTAFTKLHTGDTVWEEELFAPFARVQIAESTGFGLPESRKEQFPGAGGSGSKAGAKIQLVGEYKSHTFAHLALGPWNVPDNKYVATVVELARPLSLFVFDLGYFKLTAFAQIVAAQAYFLSRLNPQTTLWEVRGEHLSPLELAHVLGKEARPLLEKRIVLGTDERVAARLIAVRMPDAIVNDRRRQARASPSDPPRLEPLHSQCVGNCRDSSDYWQSVRFKMASGTGVQGLEKPSPSRHADHDHQAEHALLSLRAHVADRRDVCPVSDAPGHRVAEAAARGESGQARPPFPGGGRAVAPGAVLEPPAAHGFLVAGLCRSRTVSEESRPEALHLCPTLARQLSVASRFF